MCVQRAMARLGLVGNNNAAGGEPVPSANPLLSDRQSQATYRWAGRDRYAPFAPRVYWCVKKNDGINYTE